MMLLLGRLINLLLLLLRPRGKTSFSLPMMLLEFLTLILMRRFVRRRTIVARAGMGFIRSRPEMVVAIMILRYVEEKVEAAGAVLPHLSI
ncbi:hypothetical protein ANAPH2_00730 [Anaplasma phagocytophilum]|nr:hypothetical protein ANAPH2_00730 [Anaplasma phagocytophilum]